MAKRKPAAPAPDPAAAAARVDVILRLRLDGAQLHDVVGFARDPGEEADKGRGGPPWDCTDAELAGLVERADALVAARAEKKQARAAALQLARREALYARAVNAGDLATALAVLKDQATLFGMYPKTAELQAIIKAQEQVIRELEADRDRPRQLEAHDGPGEAGGPDGDDPGAGAGTEEGGGEAGG